LRSIGELAIQGLEKGERASKSGCGSYGVSEYVHRHVRARDALVKGYTLLTLDEGMYRAAHQRLGIVTV
jgi:hypothetical protein